MGEIGAKMRKGVTFGIRVCFRSVWNHPFLVTMLCFLILLYRSFPFMFSLVVSVSPVCICTALLLGTLLSFGQVNLPDIEIESKSLHDSASLKTSVSEADTIVLENGNRNVERYGEESMDVTDKLSDERSELNEVRGGSALIGTASLVSERSMEKEKAEWYDGRISDDDIVENHYSSITHDKSAESDDERSESGSFDSERVNVDTLDSPPGSPFKRFEERVTEEEEKDGTGGDDDGDDESLNSESDQAESSSPDASMADIMPMLDELHPLLDEEAPQPVNMSANGSAAESERSSQSSSHESEEQTENEEDSEIGEDDNDDGEVVVEGNKEEQTKSAIKWTEEDEKNLMDLGSSEIERNQRLENLILRRRARKNLSMLPERNLIDFESLDFPFNVAPISTTRQNPFDNSYDNSGLPPIPGSAPVLLQRRNPFDIPYDSSEEKPNLGGDGLKEEFTTFQSKEPFFRRHESFNVGPSIFAPGREDVKLRPYFVPEQMVPEESSYMSFHGQSSDLSESKVSSVPETESLGSVSDLEERKLTDDDRGPELESLPTAKAVTEENLLEKSGPSSIKEYLAEEDELQEIEPVSDIEHVSGIIGHGSQSSSEEEESLEIKAEDSSSSALSEQSKTVFTETQDMGRNVNAKEPGISNQTSVEINDLTISSTVVNDIPVREPVYDSSPRHIDNNLSFSSISSDVHAELDLPPVLVKKMVPFVERESEASSTSGEMEEISNIEVLTESSSSAHVVDEHKPRIIDVIDERQKDDLNSDVSESSIKASVEEIVTDRHNQREVSSSTLDEYVVKSLEEIIESGQSPNSDSDVYVEAYDKFSLTPCAGGNAVSFFHDKQMHRPTLTHLKEVQERNALTESSNGVSTIKESNKPELQELDQDISSVVNPPLTPNMILVPPAADEAIPHADVHTVVEETDEIKEMIDEGILSELHGIGDFGVGCIDSVGESSSLENHAETSIAAAIEVNSVNIVESSTCSVNSREEKDIHEEELNDRDGQDSVYQSSSSNDAPEDTSVDPVSTINYEDNDYWTPKTEVDSFFKKAESAVLEPPRGELVTAETMTEHENSAVLEPTQAMLVIEETLIEHSEGRTDHVNSVVPIEDASLDKQVDDRSVEHHEFTKSVDDDVHVIATRDIQEETTVDLHVSEPISSEGTSMHLDHEVKAHVDVSHSGTSHKGKGKSKSSKSCSSSSSSSDSSSSDTDTDTDNE